MGRRRPRSQKNRRIRRLCKKRTTGTRCDGEKVTVRTPRTAVQQAISLKENAKSEHSLLICGGKKWVSSRISEVGDSRKGLKELTVIRRVWLTGSAPNIHLRKKMESWEGLRRTIRRHFR